MYVLASHKMVLYFKKKIIWKFEFIEIQKINFLSFFFDIFIPARIGSDYFKYKKLNQLDKKKIISSIIYLRYHFLICLLIVFLFFITFFSINPLFAIVITIFFSYLMLYLLDIVFNNYQNYFYKKI